MLKKVLSLSLIFLMFFVASCGPKTYTVIVDPNNGSAATEYIVEEGLTVEAQNTPSSSGNKFLGWFVGETEYDFDTLVSSDFTITASWRALENYTVSFVTNTEDVIADIAIVEDSLLSEPDALELYGYNFVHWYTTDENVAFDFSVAVTSDLTLNALWVEKEELTVSYNVNGGSEVASETVLEGYLATVPEDPTLYGYNFVRWYLEDETIEFDFNSGISESIVLNAYWSEKEIYTITFNSRRGTEVDDIVLLEGEKLTSPEDPYKVGYCFEYWYHRDTEVGFDFDSEITEDINLTASYRLANTYKIEYYSFNRKIDYMTYYECSEFVEPEQPTASSEYVFEYWYLDDENVPFDFNSEITSDIQLHVKWEDTEDRINKDIAEYQALLDAGYDSLPIYSEGSKGSVLSYSSNSDYISQSGIVHPLLKDDIGPMVGDWVVTFNLEGKTVNHTFKIPIEHTEEVVIAESRVIPFENLTTEYEVDNGNVTLYFEEGGSVPYINVQEFLALLDGFIDPDLEMTYTLTEDNLNIFYQYYDEDEDHTYDLILDINATENTITTNDPGFYWAYVYTTETNYGRHIEYVLDHPEESYEEGTNVVYDLDDYNMDIVVYEGQIVMPYYMTNQLFAGSSYYNVYYNHDGLFGIYSLPDDDSREFGTIHNSTMNNEDIPADLLIHTFDMLAFDLDYLYGLKDIMGIDTYYGLLFDNIDGLLNQDAEEFEDGLRDVLLLGLDEPHTSYGYHSYFNDQNYDGPVTNTLSVYGTRFVKWYYDGLVATDNAIGDKWGEASSGWNSSNKPDYWFLDDTTVMLSLNGFSTKDIEESSVFDSSIVASMLEVDDITEIMPAATNGDKFFYYNNSDENNRIVDIIIKGEDSFTTAAYIQALTNLGYTHHSEGTIDLDKVEGYYSKTVTIDGVETTYMVVVHFDLEYYVMHIGISDFVPSSYTSNWPVVNNAEDLIYGDSAVYMEFMLQEIFEEKPGITDIVLDLSWNTGGNVGALYRVVGFITNEPFEVTRINGSTGSKSTSFVQVTGVPDYSMYNWSLLTTPTSFSAANSLATIFKANDLGPIIGVKSGGGASSITPILLPNGTAFTMSSNSISAYRTGSGTASDPYVYHHNEFGIVPDYEIDISDIYNQFVLLPIIKGE